MRRKGHERRTERTDQDDSVQASWLCRCSYTNVATGRCYYCGARPPRSRPFRRVEERPVASDA